MRSSYRRNAVAAVAGMFLMPLASQAATETVLVSSTESGLSSSDAYYITPSGNGSHYVNYPATYNGSTRIDPKNVLVVFLPGTGATPSGYTDVVNTAAAHSGTTASNYAAIGLAYVTGGTAYTVGGLCGNSADCYEQYRGENIYGKNIAYPGGTSYDATTWENASSPQYPPVNLGDSVINRLVFLLDFLSHQTASKSFNPNPSYWAQFLVTDTSNSSPYITPYDLTGNLKYDTGAHTRHVTLLWSNIVIAGHSQGGGNAAFIAMTMPGGVRRAVLLSSPQDNLDGNSSLAASPLLPVPGEVPAWISAGSNTALSEFYALRSGVEYSGEYPSQNPEDSEGVFGNNVWNSWYYLGGSGIPLGTETSLIGTAVGDGSSAPSTGSHRLYLSTSGVCSYNLNCHNSTAADGAHPAGITTVWSWMFSDGGAD